MKNGPEVLFVCVHNAGRSLMAAALLDREAKGKVRVRSAGSTPAKEIHAGVREAMAEVGIDLSREFPKPLTNEAVRDSDVVITMGCGDACPVYPDAAAEEAQGIGRLLGRDPPARERGRPALSTHDCRAIQR